MRIRAGNYEGEVLCWSPTVTMRWGDDHPVYVQVPSVTLLTDNGDVEVVPLADGYGTKVWASEVKP